METLISLLPFVAIALVFWLLVILPTRRRQKATADLQAALQPGDEVMLTSGFFGTLRAMTDDRVTLELAHGVHVQVARAAVATKVETEPAATDDPPVVEEQ